jgi:hypothetical protein
LKAFDAVIKHLFKGFKLRKSQLSDFGGVHAMVIIISFLAATPVEEKKTQKLNFKPNQKLSKKKKIVHKTKNILVI